MKMLLLSENLFGANNIGEYNNIPGNSRAENNNQTVTNKGLQSMVGAPGTLQNLVVNLAVAPGSGKSRTYTVRKNNSDTGLTVTISDAATSGSDTTHTVSVAAGDYITLHKTASGTPLQSDGFASIEWEGSNSQQCWGLGSVGVNNASNSVQNFAPLISGVGAGGYSTSIDVAHSSLCPIAGTITALYVQMTTAPASGKSREFSIYKNGSQEASSSFSISNTNTTGNVTGLSIAISPGDTLSIETTPTGTPSNDNGITWAVAITPTTDGEWPMCANYNAGSASAVRYLRHWGGGGGQATNEIDTQYQPGAAMVVKKLYIAMASAPGSGKSFTYRSRVGGSNGNLTVTISDAATTGNDTTHSDAATSSDLINLSGTPSGTPTTSNVQIGMIGVYGTGASPQDIILPLIGPTSALYAPALGFTSSGLVVGAGHRASPYISAFIWKSAGGLGERYAPPSPALSGMASSLQWHPSALWVAFVSAGALHVYPWSMLTGFGSRLANPSPMPAGTVTSVRWSPNGRVMIIGHTGAPFITAYHFSVAGFGAAYTAPSQLPVGYPTSIAWHPANSALGVTFETSPYFYTWAFDTTTGWGARYAPPFLAPSSYKVTSLSWRKDGTQIVVGFWQSPRWYLYDWGPGFSSGLPAWGFPIPHGVVFDADANHDNLVFAVALGFGTPAHADEAAVEVFDYATRTAFPDPSEVPELGPGAFAAGVAWHPEGTDIVVTSDGEPYIRAWPWDDGFGTAYDDPPDTPEADDDPDTYPPPLMSKPAWGGLTDQDIVLPLIGPTSVVYAPRIGNGIDLPFIESTSQVFEIELRADVAPVTPLGEIGRSLEIEFEPGVWTDVIGYTDSATELDWQRGVDENRDPMVGTMSFDLSNVSEDFTSGKVSAPWWNKLLPGIGVRYVVTYENVSLPRFRGTITDIQPSFGSEGTDDHRLSISCEAMSGLLARTNQYTLAAMTGSDVDACIAAVIEAPQFEIDGATAILYLLDDSAMVLPYFWNRGNALADIVAAAQCGLGDVFWEDGAGQQRLTAVGNLVGRYATPQHTWGQLVSPDGDVEPDWRWTSQTARQSVTVQLFEAGVGTIDLYEYPYNEDNALSPLVTEGAPLTISGEFTTIPLNVSDFGADSVLEGNDDPDGGGSVALMQGTIDVNGTNFTVVIYSAGSSAYMTRMKLRGTGFVVSSQGAPKVTYSKAIPYIPGLPEATAIDLPYLDYAASQQANAYAQGTLRGGRVPAPWIDATFTIDSDEKARSLLRAEINDLVLWEGTGNFRERIREWYRIMSLQETSRAEELITYKVKLAPAHLIRDPHNCAYSNGVAGLGGELEDQGFQIGTVASGTDWHTHSAGIVPDLVAGDPFLADLNGSDQIVIVDWDQILSGGSYATGDDEGGVGAVFRANSDGSERWEARFDPDNSRIVVWNTSDGLVASYAWTPVERAEIEVRALADRIRVYLNCRPEPIIDLPNRTRFQGNEYAGGCAKLSSFALGTTPLLADFYAQRA